MSRLRKLKRSLVYALAYDATLRALAPVSGRGLPGRARDGGRPLSGPLPDAVG